VNTRSFSIAALVLLGACAGGPREGDRPPSFLPPPRLDDSEFEKIGREAGEGLAAATTAVSALGKGPVRFAGTFNMIPSRELKEIDERALNAGFAAGSGVDMCVSGLTSFTLSVDVLTFVHRGHDNSVRVEYSFDFLLVDTIGGNPWARCVTRTVEGGRGDLVPQPLTLRDLDVLAAQGAQNVREGLVEMRTRSVHVVPRMREGPGSAIVIAFEDRLRAALIERGMKLAGISDYVVDLEAGIFEPVDKRARAVRAAPETGAETYEFVVNLSHADSTVPFKPWHQLRTCSAP